MNILIAIAVMILYMIIGTLLGYWFYMDGWWDIDSVVYSTMFWPVMYTIIFSIWVSIWIIEKIRGDN